jgi:hypothetical protein
VVGWVVESYDRDAATVYSPAEQFEQVGALLSAADAAAWAGVLFSFAGDRRRTMEAAAAAAHRLTVLAGAGDIGLMVGTDNAGVS